MAGQEEGDTLVWDAAAVADIVTSQLQPGIPAKFFEFPKARYAYHQYDTVRLNGRPVGVSTDAGYLVNDQVYVSLATIDADVAEDGTEVEVVWGESPVTSKPQVEEHRQAAIHASVASAPYDAFARDSFDRSTREVATLGPGPSVGVHDSIGVDPRRWPFRVDGVPSTATCDPQESNARVLHAASSVDQPSREDRIGAPEVTIYVTSGAKKNVGDYLIHERGQSLIRHLLPDETTRSVARWDRGGLPTDASRLVICGGPAITGRMLEDTFPIVESAVQRGIPIVGIGLGWSGQPPRDPGAFQMSARSVEMLRGIVDSTGPIAVRDDVTQEVAHQLGVLAVRSGCPVWYSLQDMGRSPAAKREPGTIVYTTPAAARNAWESVALMRMLKKRYPSATIVASFHRGILPDSETGPKDAAAFIAQATVAKALGFKVLDAAYELSKIDFYRYADLHVGYRVHAHLSFVSQRIPSVLICEDGRGYGQSTTLNPEYPVLWSGDAGLVPRVDELLASERQRGWPSLRQAVDIIEGTYPTMESSIRQLAASHR